MGGCFSSCKSSDTLSLTSEELGCSSRKERKKRTKKKRGGLLRKLFKFKKNSDEVRRNISNLDDAEVKEDKSTEQERVDVTVDDAVKIEAKRLVEACKSIAVKEIAQEQEAPLSQPATGCPRNPKLSRGREERRCPRISEEPKISAPAREESLKREAEKLAEKCISIAEKEIAQEQEAPLSQPATGCSRNPKLSRGREERRCPRISEEPKISAPAREESLKRLAERLVENCISIAKKKIAQEQEAPLSQPATGCPRNSKLSRGREERRCPRISEEPKISAPGREESLKREAEQLAEKCISIAEKEIAQERNLPPSIPGTSFSKMPKRKRRRKKHSRATVESKLSAPRREESLKREAEKLAVNCISSAIKEIAQEQNLPPSTPGMGFSKKPKRKRGRKRRRKATVENKLSAPAREQSLKRGAEKLTVDCISSAVKEIAQEQNLPPSIPGTSFSKKPKRKRRRKRRRKATVENQLSAPAREESLKREAEKLYKNCINSAVKEIAQENGTFRLDAICPKKRKRKRGREKKLLRVVEENEIGDEEEHKECSQLADDFLEEEVLKSLFQRV